jgi:hypothetical protein
MRRLGLGIAAVILAPLALVLNLTVGLAVSMALRIRDTDD